MPASACVPAAGGFSRNLAVLVCCLAPAVLSQERRIPASRHPRGESETFIHCSGGPSMHPRCQNVGVRRVAMLPSFASSVSRARARNKRNCCCNVSRAACAQMRGMSLLRLRFWFAPLRSRFISQRAEQAIFIDAIALYAIVAVLGYTKTPDDTRCQQVWGISAAPHAWPQSRGKPANYVRNGADKDFNSLTSLLAASWLSSWLACWANHLAAGGDAWKLSLQRIT